LLPLYPDDRAQLADIVRRTFVVTWSKDFVAEAKPDQFSYRGFHFSVALNEDDRKEAKSEIAGLVAELQIHTPGESVWASVNHDLIYKAPVEIPANLRRSLNRISALLELVDTEMSNTRKQILGLEGSSVARVLAALEKHFFLLRGEPYDTRLSRIVLEALAPLVDSDTFEANIDQFVKMNGGKLDHVFREYEGAEHVMLTQPESLLIFYLSSSHTPELQTCWPGTLPQAILEDLFSIWVPQATTN
jgi:hypothetical protein